jgi:hypothetical protein
MANLPSERSKVMAILAPDAATTARTSAYISGALFHALKIGVLVGDASATGTLTLIKAADTNGGSSASIATQAYGGTGTVGDTKAFVINVGQADDYYDSARPYFAIGLGGGVANAAAWIEGVNPRYSRSAAGAMTTVTR